MYEIFYIEAVVPDSSQPFIRKVLDQADAELLIEELRRNKYYYEVIYPDGYRVTYQYENLSN